MYVLSNVDLSEVKRKSNITHLGIYSKFLDVTTKLNKWALVNLVTMCTLHSCWFYHFLIFSSNNSTFQIKEGLGVFNAHMHTYTNLNRWKWLVWRDYIIHTSNYPLNSKSAGYHLSAYMKREPQVRVSTLLSTLRNSFGEVCQKTMFYISEALGQSYSGCNLTKCMSISETWKTIGGGTPCYYPCKVLVLQKRQISTTVQNYATGQKRSSSSHLTWPLRTKKQPLRCDNENPEISPAIADKKTKPIMSQFRNVAGKVGI